MESEFYLGCLFYLGSADTGCKHECIIYLITLEGEKRLDVSHDFTEEKIQFQSPHIVF